MVEQLKSKRVEFQLGKQKEFIINSKNDLDLSWVEFSKIAKTSVRNLNDWKNEKVSMSFSAVENICNKRKCEIPESIILRNQYWYVKKAAKLGGKVTVEKYGMIGGDQEVRKEKWKQWWEKEGKKNPNKILQPLPFSKPKFSNELAEFVGIMLGDGGMTRNQVKITLHSKDDLEYSKFVENLIKKLFKIKIGRKNRRDCEALDVVISRVELVKFLVGDIGLSIGNKTRQQVGVPNWISCNNDFKIACLRGLIDTDGSIYDHIYESKGGVYRYKKLQFTNLSKPLIDFVYKILLDAGFNPRIYKERDMRLESRKDVEKYFKIIGTHNKKHLDRYKR